LAVSLFVAVTAIFGFGKRARLDKFIVLGSRIAGKRKVALREKVIVGFSNFVRVILALCACLGLRLSGYLRHSREPCSPREANRSDNQNSAHMRIHRVPAKNEAPRMKSPAFLYSATGIASKCRYSEKSQLRFDKSRLRFFEFVRFMPFGSRLSSFALPVQGLC